MGEDEKRKALKREHERLMRQIEREIEVEQTITAAAMSVLAILFVVAMLFDWTMFGY